MIKTLIVLTGALFYSFYNTKLPIKSPPLPADKLAFLKAHQDEIAGIYQSKNCLGNWTFVGTGRSKKVFEHPDLPGLVVKFPKNLIGFRGTFGEDDLRIHHASLTQFRSVAAQFDRIYLPESYLYQTNQGVIVVEEKILFDNFTSITDGPDKTKTMNQFNDFIKAVNLCDLYPEENQNAGIMYHTSPPKVAIIDADCRMEIGKFELF